MRRSNVVVGLLMAAFSVGCATLFTPQPPKIELTVRERGVEKGRIWLVDEGVDTSPSGVLLLKEVQNYLKEKSLDALDKRDAKYLLALRSSGTGGIMAIMSGTSSAPDRSIKLIRKKDDGLIGMAIVDLDQNFVEAVDRLLKEVGFLEK
jgi:hypothetical protein